MSDFKEIEEIRTKEIIVGKRHVGCVMRGRPLRLREKKVLPEDNPIHIDCILPKGHLIGYEFDEEAFYAGGYIVQEKLKKLDGRICSDESVPRHYRLVNEAKKFKILSTLILLEVSYPQAIKFTNYWEKVVQEPPRYNSCFKNCATLCYEAFREAGLIRRLLPPLKPQKIYHALHSQHAEDPNVQFITSTGYFGLEKNRMGDHKIILIETMFK